MEIVRTDHVLAEQDYGSIPNGSQGYGFLNKLY
jgi:hypothetical protein